MILHLLASIYAAVVRRRNRRYDDERASVVTVACPVISVGNLTTGGTGKTPVVQLLVRMLQQAGWSPAVVLRGYRRSSRGVRTVHDGNTITATVEEAGDEAMLHALRLNVPVVVGESKVDAAVHAAGMLPCDVIVVDDGFQHRALHRDVDVVLVNAETMKGKLLPEGRLREPLTSLHRATVVLLTGDGVHAADVAPYVAPSTLIGRVQVLSHHPELSGKSVVAMAGIAHPERFARTIRACGASIVEECWFADHHRYTTADIERVLRVAQQWQADVVTTEKDHVKLEATRPLFEAAGVTLRVVTIEAHLVDGAAIEDHLLTILSGSRDDEDRHQ